MDEISHEPRWEFRLPRGRWLAALAAVCLIAAIIALAATSGGGRHRAAPQVSAAVRKITGRPVASRVLGRIHLPVTESSEIAVLGLTAWVADWDTGKVVAVDLAARRVTKVLQVGGVQNGPVSMATGAGSLWVLDFAAQQVLRIAPATGAVTSRISIPVQATDLSYGDGYVWVISDGTFSAGAEEELYKISPARDAVVQAAPIPGDGPGCVAAPGPQGIWTGCAGVPGMTLIDAASLKPERKLPTAPGDITQIVPGAPTMWLVTNGGLVRVNAPAARITATVPTMYEPGADSAPAGSGPAAVMDRQGRVWVATGAGLDVLLPGSLTLRPVAHTAGTVSVVTEGPGVWVDTGSTLVELDVYVRPGQAPDNVSGCTSTIRRTRLRSSCSEEDEPQRGGSVAKVALGEWLVRR